MRIGWSSPFKHPPRTLIYLVGRSVKQFDIPLRATDVRMENELIRLSNPMTDETPYVGWLRRSAVMGEALLAGLYTICELPRARGRFFKGVTRYPEARRRSSAPRTVRTAPWRSSPTVGASASRATTASIVLKSASCA